MTLATSLRSIGAALALLFVAAPSLAGGLDFVEFHPAGGPGNPLRDVTGIAVSLDGTSVYTAGGSADVLAAYTRNLATGALTFLESHEDGVGGVDGIRGNMGIAVSPDGECVYATGRMDNDVAVFDRNTVTGALTFVGTEAVDNAFAVAVSPDAFHVYVSGIGMGNLGVVEVFGRTPPACGLTAIETESGDLDGLGKGEPEAMVLTGDGAHLYVSGTFTTDGITRGAVSVFSRNAGTGQLTFVEREYNGANGIQHMGRVDALAASFDLGGVYAASRDDKAITVFDRNAGTGDITFVEAQRDGGAVDGLNGIRAVLASPLNEWLYAASGSNDNAAAVFRRSTTTDALRFLEVHKDPTIDPPNEVLPSGRALGVSPLGDTLYVGGKGITVFDVDECGNGLRGNDEQCDDGNIVAGDGCSSGCRLELCGAMPAAGCRGTAPLASQLSIKNSSPDTKDQFQLKWSAGDATTLAEFGDPLTTASYLVCVYDASGDPQPLMAAAAPAGDTCKKGKPCWKAATTSYKYNDGLYTPDGLQSVQLKEGLTNGKAKIQVKGRGINLLPPTAPLVPPVTVQVHNTATSVCWDAVFTTLDDNQGEKIKGKGN